MIYTTLERIRAHSPCADGWKKLLDHLGKTQADDEPLPMTAVLESNGLDDALWCLRAEPQHSAIWRLLAVHYARDVQHLMTDPRSLAALDVAERHAHGQATDDDLAAAGEAARAAELEAGLEAAGASAWAARAAEWAAEWAAGASAGASAWAAARRDARAAAGAAEWAARAARDARDKQAADLRTVLEHYDAAPGCEIHGWRVTA
jgi:hypothetical protein